MAQTARKAAVRNTEAERLARIREVLAAMAAREVAPPPSQQPRPP